MTATTAIRRVPVTCDREGCDEDVVVVTVTDGDDRTISCRCDEHGELWRERHRLEVVRAFLNPGGLQEVGRIWAPVPEDDE